MDLLAPGGPIPQPTPIFTEVTMHCTACNAKIESNDRFCAECGSPLESPDAPGKRGSRSPKGRTKYYYGQARYAEDTAKIVERFLASQNLVTQVLNDGAETVLQAQQKPNLLRKTLGLDQAVTVQIVRDGGDLRVTVGGAKWLDKAAGAGIGWFVFAPAILTAGYGIHKQMQLFGRVEAEIETFLATKS
ncbi:MAG: zinc ribbon domain-containing protein [Rhodothermales bacterium]